VSNAAGHAALFEVEAVSILGAAIDYFRPGQVSLRPPKAGTPATGSTGKSD